MHYADPYAIAGRWYKGNLHTHTTQSDGELSPEDVVRRYEEMGYDFLALTDHNKLTDPSPLQSRTKLTLIPGFEFGHGFTGHVLCLGVQQAYKGSYQDVISTTYVLGGVAILCHPNWVRPDLWSPEDMIALRYYAGIEIFNKVITRLEGSAFAVEEWDLLLTQGYRVWGYTNEDAHRLSDMGGCFNVVKARSATADNLLHSLERGHFYASTGLLFTSLGYSDGMIGATVDGAATVRFIGPEGRLLATATGQQAAYSPTGEAYVRVEAEDSAGHRAWSQPFWRIAE